MDNSNKSKVKNKTMDNKPKEIKVQTAQKQQLDVMIKMIWAVCAYSVFLAAAVLMTPTGVQRKTPQTLESKALQHISINYDIDSKTLKHERTVYDNNKQFIYFTQEYQGIPVYNSRSVVYVNKGNYDYVKLNYNEVGDFDTSMVMPKTLANDVVKQELANLISHAQLETEEPFEDGFGGIMPQSYYDIAGNLREYDYSQISDEDVVTTSTDLLIYKNDKKNYLTYKIDLPLLDKLPAQFTFFVDAQTGELINAVDNLKFYNISGTVTGMEWEDPFTDSVQLEKQLSNQYIDFDSQQERTDDEGYYSGSGSNLEATLQGPYVSVFNYQESESEHSKSFNGDSTHNWNWDADDTSYLDEESNVFYHVNRIFDYIVGIGAYEMIFNMTAKVNKNATCNAFYNTAGPSINFYQAGNGCESTGVISDIILHEYGHGIVHALDPTVTYAGYWDQPGNIHEAISDYWACTVNNNPNQGEGFFVDDPNGLRVCNSDDIFPDDYDPEPHSGPQILSGALWDIREEIGKEVLDPMIIQALRLQPIYFIEILESLLIVDDDNGNLLDGTPNISTICSAFSNHGINYGYCAGYTDDPLAIVVDPEPGNVISGMVDITGTAYPSEGDDLVSYTLLLDEQELGVFTDSVVEGTLMVEFDTSEFSEGEHTLKLVVTDSDEEKSVEVEIVIDNAAITNPVSSSVFYPGEIITINGTAAGSEFVDYVIEWSAETNPDNWQTTGITLADGGLIAVMNDALGSWNTSSLSESDIYYLRLTVNFGDESSETDTNDIFLEFNLQEGFPYSIGPPDYMGNPKIVDLNGDGQKEIITLSRDGNLYVIQSNGENFPGWPVLVDTYNNHISSPAIADINGDGVLDIIVRRNGKLVVLNISGETIWERQINPAGYTLGYTISSPVIFDLDGDGNNEIIVGTDEQLYVVDSEGEDYPGWPVEIAETEGAGYATPAVADLNGDGNAEIVARIVYMHDGQNEHKVGIFSKDGDEVGNHIFNCPNSISSYSMSPVIGDIDGDEMPDIVYSCYVGYREWMFYVQRMNGTIKNQWSATYVMGDGMGLSLGNVNDDDLLDIVFSGGREFLNNSANTPVVITDYNENIKKIYSYLGPTPRNSEVMLLDLDNNLVADALVNILSEDYSVNKLVAFDSDGEIPDNFPRYYNSLQPFRENEGIAVDDLDGDGDLEIVSVTHNGSVYAWDLDIEYNSQTMEWPMFRHDIQNTGNYHFVVPETVATTILKNSSFEIDAGIDFYPNYDRDDATALNVIPDGYIPDLNCTEPGCSISITLDDLVKYHSNYSAKLDTVNTHTYLAQDIPIEHNRRYKVTGYVKTDCDDENCHGTILTECKGLNEAGEHPAIWDNCALNTVDTDITRLYGDNDWTQISFNVAADNANAEFLRVVCYNSPNTGGTGTVWCDSFEVEDIGIIKPDEEDDTPSENLPTM
jgi:hypothetical protein